MNLSLILGTKQKPLLKNIQGWVLMLPPLKQSAHSLLKALSLKYWKHKTGWQTIPIHEFHLVSSTFCSSFCGKHNKQTENHTPQIYVVMS